MIEQIKYTRIGICGSRNLGSVIKLKEFIYSIPAGTTVVSGGSGIVDKTAASLSRYRGLPVKEIYADWQRYGKAAGPIRNGLIIREGIQALFAFPDDHLHISPGTANCISQARKAGIPVFVL